VKKSVGYGSSILRILPSSYPNKANVGKKEAINMMRIGRIGRLKPGKVEEYIQLHKNMAPELLQVLSDAGIKNFSIYKYRHELFSYLECDDWDASMAHLETDPPTQEWSQLMMTLLDEPLPWEILEEVFHMD
jgi:L-rhamnose mutarotase